VSGVLVLGVISFRLPSFQGPFRLQLVVLGGLWSWIGPDLLAVSDSLAFILDGNGAWLGSNGALLGPDTKCVFVSCPEKAYLCP